MLSSPALIVSGGVVVSGAVSAGAVDGVEAAGCDVVVFVSSAFFCEQPANTSAAVNATAAGRNRIDMRFIAIPPYRRSELRRAFRAASSREQMDVNGNPIQSYTCARDKGL